MCTTIEFAVSEQLRWDNEVIKTFHEALPYYVPGFVSANFHDRKVSIATSFSNQIKNQYLTTSLQDLAATISKGYRDIAETISKSFTGTGEFAIADPFEELIASGDIISTGRGKFVYRNRMVRLYNCLDHVLKNYCLSRGGLEEIYPSTVKASSLRKAGYLSLHPHLAFFVAPVAKRKNAIDTVGSLPFDEHNSDINHEKNALFEFPTEVLSPTVCYHCFEALSGKRVQTGRFTALNNCHRHEPVNVEGLSRLTTYSMRELIIFDGPDAVADELNRSIEFTCNLLETLDVGYEVVTANDPFFGTEGAGNRLMQTALELKREIKVTVWGGRKISVGSFNLHQDTLVKKFGIEGETSVQQKLWSGCVGWGFDRLLLGILSRYGTDLDSWPKKVKNILFLDKF